MLRFQHNAWPIFVTSLVIDFKKLVHSLANIAPPTYFFLVLESLKQLTKSVCLKVVYQQHRLFVCVPLWYTQEPLLFNWESSTGVRVVKSERNTQLPKWKEGSWVWEALCCPFSFPMYLPLFDSPTLKVSLLLGTSRCTIVLHFSNSAQIVTLYEI